MARKPTADHTAHPHHPDHPHQPRHVRAAYEQYRQHPYGKSHHASDVQRTETFQPERVRTRQGLIGHDVFAQGHPAYQKPQGPEDRHDTHYDNDVSSKSWLRGAGEDATNKPSFDKSNPWRKGR